MFSKWPNSREKLLKTIGNDTSAFLNYPKLTNAMYAGVNASNIPIELQNIAEEYDNEYSTAKKIKSRSRPQENQILSNEAEAVSTSKHFTTTEDKDDAKKKVASRSR